MQNFLTFFKIKYKAWSDERTLKKSGFTTWKAYNQWHDPDVCQRATIIKDFYHGYPFVYVCDSYNHYCYKELADFGPGGVRYGMHDMQDWLKANHSGRVRWEMHRVIYNNYTGWEINEIGGADYMFFAFKNEQDYAMFMLRWS